MGPRPLYCLTAFLLAACQSAPDDDLMLQVREEVRAATEELLAAKNLPDGNAVVEFYQDDPRFSYLGCTDFTIGGETFNALFPQVYDRREPGSFDMRVADIKVLGPNAAVVSLVGSTTTQPHLFSTMVWVRDGDWQVALEHASWPGCRPPAGPHPLSPPTRPRSDAPEG
jgi:ketosteroid isomerase-like protein